MWLLAALTALTAALVRRIARRGPVDQPSRAVAPLLLVATLGVAVTQVIVVAALPVIGRQLGVSRPSRRGC